MDIATSRFQNVVVDALLGVAVVVVLVELLLLRIIGGTRLLVDLFETDSLYFDPFRRNRFGECR